jgi:hypothetical protein
MRVEELILAAFRTRGGNRLYLSNTGPLGFRQRFYGHPTFASPLSHAIYHRAITYTRLVTFLNSRISLML